MFTDVTVQFKALSDAAVLPSAANAGDAGYDLTAVEAGVVPARGRATFGTGIAVALPDGWGGFVLPRSGLAAKHGVTVLNAPGLIDSGYRGEVRVVLVNHSDDDYTVSVGDRVAQLVVQRAGIVEWVQAAELDDTDRGASGFGGSGR